MNKYSWWEILLLRLTHRLWNRVIFHVISEHSQFKKGVSAGLSNYQLHALLAEFDPSQNQPWVSTKVERANTYYSPRGGAH